MSAAKQLENRVRESLKKQFPDETEHKAVGFSWEILVGPIIDIILTMLDGCLARFNRDKVAKNAVRDGIITRWVIRKAVRKSELGARSDQEMAYRVIHDVLTNSKEQEAAALVAELDESSPQWSLW